ncbi:MAG: NADP-dependent oxidoreductase [Usitatibacteraceae bacterium]
MKAIVLSAFGSADNLHDAELPNPALRPGDVRIKVSAIAFNPVDFQVRMGRRESKNANSMILGRDLAGTVDDVYPGVAGFNVGDEVFCNVNKLATSGTYAEYVCVPAELVAKKPTSLSHEQAAAVPVAATTALLALRKAQVGPGKSVFIGGGAGGVGTFALGLARQLGARTLFTTAGSAKSRAYLVEQCGLHDEQIIDYRSPDFEALAMQRNGGGFDSVVDLVGGGMLSSCSALVGVEGNLASVTEAPTQADFDILFDKNASFHPVGANAYSLMPDRRSWLKYRDMLDHLSQLFDSGALAPAPITNLGTFSAAVVKRAHALMENNTVQGKLVMTCP